MNGLNSHRGNHAIRMCRRNSYVRRLYDWVERGTKTERVKVEELRNIILAYDDSLSQRECGYIIRKAFPYIERRRVHHYWYYYGVQLKSTCNPKVGNSQCIYPNIKSQLHMRDDCNGKNSSEGVTVHIQQPPHNGNDILQKICAGEKTKENYLVEPKQKHQENGKLHRIPSLNICMDTLAPIDQCTLIGEGTFGKCMAGTYQHLPVAIKIFRDSQSVRSVHHEADILLKIPSHANITMLIGVQTVKRPYLLLSRLCLNDGKPETYSNYLHNFKSLKSMHLKDCIHLLLEIAEALNHIHGQGIIHNDIKGNNVVIEGCKGSQHAILIDFGKAVVATQAKKSHHKLFTEKEVEVYRMRFPHVAPEVAKGAECQSYKSDAYSYGYLFCSTLKRFRKELELVRDKDVLLSLGKKITSPNSKKRVSLEVVISALPTIKY